MILMALGLSLLILSLPLGASAAGSDTASRYGGTGSGDSTRMSADDGDDPDGWEYDTYYIFPLTRHMSDSGLPRAGQIALYPLAFVIDLGQWPFGALAGLAGR